MLQIERKIGGGTFATVHLATIVARDENDDSHDSLKAVKVKYFSMMLCIFPHINQYGLIIQGTVPISPVRVLHP